MMKSVGSTLEIRVRTLLCCSAAVLLTACGGSSEAPNSAATTQAPQNAAAAPVQEAAPSTVPATQVATAADVSGNTQDQAAAPAANFAMTGYDSAPAAAEAAPAADAAPQAQPAPAAQEQPAPAPATSAPTQTRLLAVVGSGTAPIPATNLYVATNGSDTNPGTQAKPFKTILRASKAAVPNTNIFVAPGTYEGGFKTTVSGIPGGRIYYVSTTKWGAKIVPPASSSNSFAWDNRGNHVQIIGFDIDGTTSRAGTKWLHGIYNGGSYGLIKDNHVHNIATAVPCNGAGGSAIGVDSYYGGVKNDVIGNVVNDIGPGTCTFVQGIYLSTTGSVKNNVVYRVSSAAIHMWHDATDVIITNNTAVASGFGIIVGGGDFYNTSGGANNTAVYNNIVFDNMYGISEQGKTGKSNTYRNNLVYQNTYNWTLKNGLTHTGTVSSNPLFVSYNKTSGTPNLRLTSSSPAIARGTATHALPTDIDGKPRNAATGYDLGAYQH